MHNFDGERKERLIVLNLDCSLFNIFLQHEPLRDFSFLHVKSFEIESESETYVLLSAAALNFCIIVGERAMETKSNQKKLTMFINFVFDLRLW